MYTRNTSKYSGNLTVYYCLLIAKQYWNYVSRLVNHTMAYRLTFALLSLTTSVFTSLPVWKFPVWLIVAMSFTNRELQKSHLNGRLCQKKEPSIVFFVAYYSSMQHASFVRTCLAMNWYWAIKAPKLKHGSSEVTYQSNSLVTFII